MAPIISSNVDHELRSKKEKRFFNLLSDIFFPPRPIKSGGRRTAGGARLPFVSSWPSRADGSQDSESLELLPLGTASSSSAVLAPETARISEFAPQLPELGLGPAFGIDFDAVPGWGKVSALSGVSLGKRFELRPNDHWRQSLDTANNGCMSPLPPRISYRK